jgi:DNA replication factor GINS
VTQDTENDEINYKTLRRIQQQEQTLPSLTKITNDFYQQLNNYTNNLENLVNKEDNAQKNKLYHEEIQNTKKLANSIYEQREKKIVQAAHSTVRGAKPDLKNLIETEKKLYDTLVQTITDARKQIFEEKQPSLHPSSIPALHEEKPPQISNTNSIIRIVEDIPEFMGTDMRTYSLKKDDIISVPTDISTLLIKRDVAHQLH